MSGGPGPPREHRVQLNRFVYRTWLLLAFLVGVQAFGSPKASLTPEQIAERTIPSVVLIRAGGGLGTGFVVAGDGLIATNLHVLKGVDEASVSVGSKQFPVLAVTAVDEKHDLVLVRIAASKLPALRLAATDIVKAGQPVIAIGHPLGLGNTVSNGLVSALREVEPELTLLQISAPISPGSSGGPLLDAHGDVIGVSTLVISRGQNLNFGMPVRYLKALLRGPQRRKTLAELNRDVARGVTRAVPRHDRAVLDGCSADAQKEIRRTISEAISVGAPLYNDGNHEACFRIYEAAILDAERSLPGCAAVKSALQEGMQHARGKTGATAKAWALRDAFDGMLELIERTKEDLPAVSRQVPKHDVEMVATCDAESVQAIVRIIESAISLGAPLYNEGNAEACFRVYQGAALDISRSARSCRGAQRALEEGMAKANAASPAEEKAWALRDAFDGLLDVIERSQRPAAVGGSERGR
jgi:serine protease Do